MIICLLVNECRYCDRESLDTNLVKGKIVLCDTWNNGSGLFLIGAAGAIMQVGFQDVAFSYPLPTTVLGMLDAGNVSLYISTSRCPEIYFLN